MDRAEGIAKQKADWLQFPRNAGSVEDLTQMSNITLAPWELAMQQAALLDDAELTSCVDCGRDLDGESHGEQCVACYISDVRYECADEQYDFSVEDAA